MPKENTLNKKYYEPPEFYVIGLMEDDVITASNPKDSWTEDKEDWYTPSLPPL